MDAALAVVTDVGIRPVLDALGLSRATFYRRRRPRRPDDPCQRQLVP